MSGAKTERVKKLERKVKELREELDRKEAQITKNLETKSEKEVALDAHISEMNNQIQGMQDSIDTENEKIKDLQAQLTAKEAALAERRISPGKRSSMYADEARDLVDAVAAVALGDREQNLLLMLEKARSDKEKAIRVLVKIAGKNKIAEFLDSHAGSPNLMDLLEEELLGQM